MKGDHRCGPRGWHVGLGRGHPFPYQSLSRCWWDRQGGPAEGTEHQADCRLPPLWCCCEYPCWGYILPPLVCRRVSGCFGVCLTRGYHRQLVDGVQGAKCPAVHRQPCPGKSLTGTSLRGLASRSGWKSSTHVTLLIILIGWFCLDKWTWSLENPLFCGERGCVDLPGGGCSRRFTRHRGWPGLAGPSRGSQSGGRGGALRVEAVAMGLSSVSARLRGECPQCWGVAEGSSSTSFQCECLLKFRRLI